MPGKEIPYTTTCLPVKNIRRIICVCEFLKIPSTRSLKQEKVHCTFQERCFVGKSNQKCISLRQPGTLFSYCANLATYTVLLMLILYMHALPKQCVHHSSIEVNKSGPKHKICWSSGETPLAKPNHVPTPNSYTLKTTYPAT